MDTLLSKVKSKLGNTCANVNTQEKFTRVVLMISRKDAGKSLIDFTDDVGIPERLVTDGVPRNSPDGTHRHCKGWEARCMMRIMLHTTEQGRKNQNHAAECEIGFLAKRWRLQITKKQVSKRLWDFGLVSLRASCYAEWRAVVADRRTGYEEVTGRPDPRYQRVARF
jgi:hypothetical protein